jgi:hypothetical protein
MIALSIPRVFKAKNEIIRRKDVQTASHAAQQFIRQHGIEIMVFVVRVIMDIAKIKIRFQINGNRDLLEPTWQKTNVIVFFEDSFFECALV